MPNGWGSIIISSGSVELSFDEALFPKVNKDKFSNPNRKVVRVKVIDEKSGIIVFDSGERLEGMKWTIVVKTED